MRPEGVGHSFTAVADPLGSRNQTGAEGFWFFFLIFSSFLLPVGHVHLKPTGSVSFLVIGSDQMPNSSGMRANEQVASVLGRVSRQIDSSS